MSALNETTPHEATTALSAAGRARTAVLVLAFCCVCWGFSFPVAKHALTSFSNHVQKTGSGEALSIWADAGVKATVNGWRFAGAALLYWLLVRSRLKSFKASDLRGSLWVGAFFSAGMLAQMVGLSYTRPSISGFLTSLVVVFAPFAQAILLRRPVQRTTWVAVAVATVGIVILAWPASAVDESVTAPPIPFLGEALTILGSLFFTGQLLTLDHFGKDRDTSGITLGMFSITALTGIGFGIAMAGSDIYRAPVLHAAQSDGLLLLSVASLIVFSTIVAMHLMNVYQPQISPATASVVYCLEPVFATLFSVGFGVENLTLATISGGGVILTAVLLVARK